MDASTALDNLINAIDLLPPEIQDGLDSLVYDSCSQTASNINNSGPDSQIEFLRETFSDEEIAGYLGLSFYRGERLFDDPSSMGND